MDRVYIEGLRLLATVGIHDWERSVPQPLLADVEMRFDCRAAAASDDIADTVDYATAAALLAELCATSHFRLLEALAEAMCQRLLDVFPISEVTLRLGKTRALRGAAGVGVHIRRRRGVR